MPRARQETAAPALIVSRFVMQRRISHRGQTIGRNELAFTRREPLRIASQGVVPLLSHPTRLIDARSKHSFRIGPGSRQGLAQVNLSTRRVRQRDKWRPLL